MLGVIGRNGAGKSTLLKVLTRITTPTSGRVEIRGRVGSLLEVGTGFHPELTGRENIYLNGAILGMKRREIQQKLPDIVEFSGVERFLDTPVKRYSSGMYVRLAFSVAAHLEPEILLVDEVLAVGDAEFQRRCLGRMEEFGATGRTVLFVSHNLQAVAQLCDRAILIEQGRVVTDGPQRGRRRALPPDVRRRRVEPHVGGPRSRPRRRPRRSSSRCGSSTATARRADYVDVREPVGVEIDFRVLASGRAGVPEDQARRRTGASRSTRWTSTSAGTSRRRPASTSRRRGSRRTAQRGARCRSTRPSARSLPKLHTTRASTRRSRSTCRIRGRATRRAARSPASGAASCARCSSGPRRLGNAAPHRDRDRTCIAPLLSTLC